MKTRFFSIIVIVLAGVVVQAGQPCIPIDHLPFTITTEGTYCAVNDLTFTAVNPTGIEIKASNVTVDLMGYAMRADAGAVQQAFVSDPVSKLVIRNGRIDGFYLGLFLKANGTTIHGLVINDASTAMHIEGNDVTIDDVVARGRDEGGADVALEALGSKWEVSRLRVEGRFQNAVDSSAEGITIRDSYLAALSHAAILRGNATTLRDSELRIASDGPGEEVVWCTSQSTSLIAGNTFSGGANTVYAIKNENTGKYRDNTALGDLKYDGGTDLGGNG